MNQRVFADLTRFDRVESDYIEPGLLSAFRLFIGFQIITLVLGLLVTLLLRPELDVRAVGLFSLVWMIPLLLYLTWPLPRRKLGRFYLPLALFVVSAVPIAQRIRFFYIQSQQSLPFTAVEIAGSSWRLLVILLAPLVFIAWQYHFRAVVLFSVGTLALTLGLAVKLLDRSSPQWIEIIDLSVSSAVSFVLIGYIITQLVGAQREKQRALAEINAKLIDHAATVEQLATSHERNRLARDLHDTLAHTLSAVSVQLEAVDSVWERSPQQARDLLHKSQGTARSGLAETRRALRALRASPLEDLGLRLALRTLAESTATRNGLALKLDLPDAISLAPELEENIYRIAQEALTNAARHAQAHTLTVRLHEEPQCITLQISDDGAGFDVAGKTRAGHYGLHGMQERAAAIGGRLTLHSAPQMGTTIGLTIDRRTGEVT